MVTPTPGHVYRFAPVDESTNAFHARCLACDEWIPIGTKWADLNGEAFKAYYCAPCKRELDGSQMTITIKINMGNAAFDGDRDAEIVRILTHWITTNMRFTGLYDINGNKVGTVAVRGK